MARIDDEAEPRLCAPGEAAKEILRRLDRRAAAVTDQVAVQRRGQMVCGRAMPQVSVDDHTEALQLVQVPVDRRHVDVRSPRLHLRGQILCSPVTTGVEEGMQQFTAGCRDPATLAA